MGGIIRALLTKLGFKHVDYAAGAATAVSMLRQRQYRLVISDWKMQPMDGYALLKLVRGDEKLSKTPFIMVTSQSTRASVAAAINAGVDDYVVKPFDADTLNSKIVHLLARSATSPA